MEVGGLVVNTLDFQPEGRWFEPGLCRHVVFLDKKLYFILSLFTLVYKWVQSDLDYPDSLGLG